MRTSKFRASLTCRSWAAVALMSAAAWCPSAAAAEKPNFVVIFIDDMGYGDIGPFGSTVGESRNVAGRHPDVVARLEEHLARCRADLDNPANCRPVGKNPNPRYLTPRETP